MADPALPAPTGSVPGRIRSRVGLLLRLGIAVLPLVWLARRIDLGQVGHSLAVLGAGPLFLAALTPFASLSVAPVRWAVLLRAYGAEPGRVPGYLTLLRHGMVGYYYNSLPGAVAGDALRAYRTRDVLSGTVDGAAVIVAERIAGLAGLLLIGSLALLGDVPRGGASLVSVLGFGAGLAGVLVLGVFVSPALYQRRVPRPARGGLVGRVDGWIRRVPTPRAPGGLVVAVLLSLVTQGFPMAQVCWLVHALSPATDPVAVLLVQPGLILLTYIPITPSAVGQREIVFVHLLGAVGVLPEQAVAASVVVLLTGLVPTAVGGIVHLVEVGRGVPAEAA